MCGACGSGRVAAPWEDVLAGAGPAARAARAGAAVRLLTGRRLRVTPWRGGYLLTTATGAARPVASLGELWAAAGGPSPAPTEQHWARAPVPAGWDLQAAAVWVAAAARAGTIAAAELPGGVVEFRDGGAAHVVPGSRTAEVGVLGAEPEAALADLLHFAAGG
ncbi:hypothetical protein Gobs01_00111 [Geodermatophilus obscurus DSM 43160]|uniref:Uncharacterized protein n=1 Tax=Geodermatophilus obscurus (strain ATCC 25078 / DSM 43160 / JCM 3152 / CCUG 61914 / KCC A-0152 / KCTC 9177 / NBRC 13315 / NRRL B-3577 / G-20) TaxID=526225 RepID=D2SH10_GEOOG|nr:conserved hypothetical protein [Geodermatophilus obscurus DSM 43160]